MAFLATRPAWLALASLALCASGCILAGRSERRFAFSHAAHVVEQGLQCANCHADAGRAEKPSMPQPDACGVCHDEIDAEKPVERRAAALFEGETYRAAHSLALAQELVFSHARHVAEVKDCARCHAAVVESSGAPSGAIRMDACTGCHAARVAATECKTCHTRVAENVAPPSHAVDWKRAHGRCARSGSDATSDRCSLCHQESTCVQCHREEAPSNHTPYWLERGHGITARMDRQNCAACHREESCASCHADAMPRNHTALFGAPRDTHCSSCHFPLANQGCVACHHDTHSHALAVPKPRDPVHIGGQNCRQCHGLQQPLPHVDNGDDCNACHH